MNAEFIIIGVTYVIITLTLYIKGITFIGFKLFPFGISTTNLNSLLVKVGSNFRRIWLQLGDISYTIFGNLSILIIPLLILLFGLNYFIKGKLYHFTIFLLENFLDYDFDSLIFWIIAFLTIFLHELFHGFQASANDIKINSVGAIALPNFLYAGYVSIDFDNSEKDPVTNKIDSHLPTDVKEFEIEDYNRIKLTKNKLESYRLSRLIMMRLRVNPFIENDKEGYVKLRRIISFGLFANLIILSLASILYLIVDLNNNSLSILEDVIGVNIFLIIFNLLPISFSDGGKLLKLKLTNFLPKDKIIIVDKILNYFSLFILIFLVL